MDRPADFAQRLACLDNLRVVLVSPKFSGNLGMVARAMTNTAIGDLRLVAPRAEINKEAYQMAPTGARLLDTARLHDTLYEAVADCGIVLGTTRRRGVIRRNVLSPEEAAEMLGEALRGNRAALVMGSEDSGLSNEDLALCHWIVGMHTGSEHESFNLSHATAILCYLINRAVTAERGARRLASAERMEAMFSDISRFLRETGFIHESDPKRMMTLVRLMLHRSGLNEREVRIIRGILRQARWRIANPDAPMVPRDTPQMEKRRLKEEQGDEDD